MFQNFKFKTGNNSFSNGSKPFKYLKTGIYCLDNCNDNQGSIRDTDLIILAGGTGTGKSMVALWMAINVASNGDKVIYMDFENSGNVLNERIKSFGINCDVLEDAHLLKFYQDDKEHSNIIKNLISEKKADISSEKYIISRIDAIENLIILEKPKMLVYDTISCLYATLLSGSKIPLMADYMATRFYELSNKYNCCIIMLEQLTKDRITGVRPTLNDIKGGSAIAHKASKIFTLFSYSSENTEKIMSAKPDFIIDKCLEIIPRKDRNNDLPKTGGKLLWLHEGIQEPSLDIKIKYTEYLFNRKSLK